MDIFVRDVDAVFSDDAEIVVGSHSIYHRDQHHRMPIFRKTESIGGSYHDRSSQKSE